MDSGSKANNRIRSMILPASFEPGRTSFQMHRPRIVTIQNTAGLVIAWTNDESVRVLPVTPAGNRHLGWIPTERNCRMLSDNREMVREVLEPRILALPARLPTSV